MYIHVAVNCDILCTGHISNFSKHYAVKMNNIGTLALCRFTATPFISLLAVADVAPARILSELEVVASSGSFPHSPLTAAIGALALENSVGTAAGTALVPPYATSRRRGDGYLGKMLTAAIHFVGDGANGSFHDVTLVPTYI